MVFVTSILRHRYNAATLFSCRCTVMVNYFSVITFSMAMVVQEKTSRNK